jgi:hypothetical protein
MMKDKKPFTYTPGGIDLSEIRSPRMAKRLQMNAMAEGVCSTPTLPANHPNNLNPPQSPHNLPPSALAAMQPQMAIPVFPQGGFGGNNNNGTRNPRPSDFANNGQNTPPPPPPPPSYQPSSQQQQQQLKQQQQQERCPTPKSPIPSESRPESAQNTCNSPGRNSPAQAPPRSPCSPVNSPLSVHVGQGSIYIPPLSPQQPQQQQQSPASSSQGQGQQRPVSPRPKLTIPPPPPPAMPVQQAVGSIYIPPIDNQQQQQQQRNTQPTQQQLQQSLLQQIQQKQHPLIPTTPPTPTPGMSSGPHPSQAASAVLAAQAAKTPNTPLSPPTPTLNKAPTPWMNSYNKMASKQAESPPYVNPANVMTPWGSLTPGPSQGGQAPSATAGAVRTIPISIQRDDGPTIQQQQQQQQAQQIFQQQQQQNQQMLQQQQQQMLQNQQQSGISAAAQHLGRVIPIQIQRQESQQGAGARSIPIQVKKHFLNCLIASGYFS